MRGFFGNWQNGGEWDWDSFENSLTEILFYPIPWSENEMQQNYEAPKKEENSMNLFLVLLLSISSVIGAGAIFIYVLRKLFNK